MVSGTRMLALALCILCFGVPAAVSAQSTGPIARYKWKNRPLLVFAPSAEHAAYREQIRRVNAHRAGFNERDMVIVAVLAQEARRDAAADRALRSRFRVGTDDFVVILIGKDGTAKDRWTEPAPMDEVFRLIDGMPMRRREMRTTDKTR